MARSIECDVLIFGLGGAGAWLLNSLNSKGYNVIGVEKTEIGDGQTVSSQGMIHGGFKYFPGVTSRDDSVSVLLEMTDRWKAHTSGERKDPDLSRMNVYSDYCYAWATTRRDAFVSAPAMARLLRTPVEKLDESDWPEALAGSKVVYRIGEQMIDTNSLLKELARPFSDRILYSDSEAMTLEFTGDAVKSVCLEDRSLTISPGTVILTAGLGNDGLAKKMGITAEISQIRPLRQVVVYGDLPQLYGHCINQGYRTRKPFITVTTHDAGRKGNAWNIGGNIAEVGSSEVTHDALIEQARIKVPAVLGAVDFSGVEWDTFYIDRSEGGNDGLLPSDVTIFQKGNVMVCWPNKLTLVPKLADEVALRLPQPRGINSEPVSDGSLRIAMPPWYVK